MTTPLRAPLIIGAVGGSGTRVVTRILARAGFHIGAWRNEAEDSKPLVAFYDKWLPRWLQGARVDDADFARAVRMHRNGLEAEAPWVVKVPRTILMLPYWLGHFSRARFVHMVRDGLDMAYSTNRFQLSVFGDLILKPADRALFPHLRAMAYWRDVNTRTEAFGRSALGDRYLLLRFEDLCATPDAAIARLAAFAGTALDVQAARSEVVPPETIGRWRSRPPDEIHQLREIAADALHRFGYDPGTPNVAAGPI